MIYCIELFRFVFMPILVYRNRGFQTIEGVLCKALVDVGLIPQDHSDDMQKVSQLIQPSK